MKVAALVPMRHDSQRVPGKNFRDFDGVPLFHHILRSLLEADGIDVIAVDTDSDVIVADMAKEFPKVIHLPRPEHLRRPETPMNEILLHDVGEIQADLYLQTHSTNPLLRPQTIDGAISRLIDTFPDSDSLFSVTRVQRRYWDSLARAVNHNPKILLPTQDLPPIYEENSCLYLFSRDVLERERNRIGQRPIMFEVDALEAMDIDEEADFVLAEQVKRLGLVETVSTVPN